MVEFNQAEGNEAEQAGPSLRGGDDGWNGLADNMTYFPLHCLPWQTRQPQPEQRIFQAANKSLPAQRSLVFGYSTEVCRLINSPVDRC